MLSLRLFPCISTPKILRVWSLSVLTGLMIQWGGIAQGATYYVTAEGYDTPDHDGLSKDFSFATLAFACEQVPEGDHRIEVGPGVFIAKRTARPRSGVTIVGMQADDKGTRIIASDDWELSSEPNKTDVSDDFLISLEKVKDVTISNLELASPAEHRITGAIYARDVQRATLAQLHVHDFRWSGLRLMHSSHLEVRDCRLENASTDKFRWHGGLISTRWIKHSRIHHNRITSTIGGGYGYKGGGHEGVRIDHNVIDVAGGFAIESAHEHEFGVEIDHNYATRCISIPKGNQSTNPNKRDFKYTFWIHDNLLTDSYTIEGPRNHLLVERNYIRIEKPNGRVYTHHGGTNHGPVWIRHNVVENVDRALVWMNEGLAENIYVYNNTVVCADAGDRAGALFGAYKAERLNNWVVTNNVFIAPAAQPRNLMATGRGVPTKIKASHNVTLHIEGVPEGNFPNQDPGLRRAGERPWPYYAPADESSFVVGQGTDVGLPFSGPAPDIGAYAWDEKRPLEEIPKIDSN